MNPNATSPITRYGAVAPTRNTTSSEPTPGADFAALLGAEPDSGRPAEARRRDTARHGSDRPAGRDHVTARDRGPRERDEERGPSARGAEAPGRITSLQARARAQVARDERLAEKAQPPAPTAPPASDAALESPVQGAPIQAAPAETASQAPAAALETAFDLTAARFQSQLTAASARTDAPSPVAEPGAPAATQLPPTAADLAASLTGAPETAAALRTDTAAPMAESLDAAFEQGAGEQSVGSEQSVPRVPLAPAQASSATPTGPVPAAATSSVPESTGSVPESLELTTPPAEAPALTPSWAEASAEAAATGNVAAPGGDAAAAQSTGVDAAVSTVPIASESEVEAGEEPTTTPQESATTSAQSATTSAPSSTATTAPAETPSDTSAEQPALDAAPADEQLGDVTSGGSGSAGGDSREGSSQPSRQDAGPVNATAATAPDESAPITGLPGVRQGESSSAIPHRSVPLERAPQAVAQLLHVATQRGVSHARIALRPEELGGIEIHLQTSAAGLTAHVIADSPEAARLLSQASEDLRRSLARHDLTLVSLDVSTSGERQQDFAASSGGWGERQSEGRPTRTTRNGAETGAADIAEVTTATSVIELPDGLLVDVLA